MSIVETCAKAMRGIIWGHDWDGLSEPCRDLYREEIRAALRSVKPEDVTERMTGALSVSIMQARAKGEVTEDDLRRAIAAAIAAGAE